MPWGCRQRTGAGQRVPRPLPRVDSGVAGWPRDGRAASGGLPADVLPASRGAHGARGPAEFPRRRGVPRRRVARGHRHRRLRARACCRLRPAGGGAAAELGGYVRCAYCLAPERSGEANPGSPRVALGLLGLREAGRCLALALPALLGGCLLLRALRGGTKGCRAAPRLSRRPDGGCVPAGPRGAMRQGWRTATLRLRGALPPRRRSGPEQASRERHIGGELEQASQ
mmetsp:Transcript_95490/g.303115  ORF Transcript_95490/g.303115 Transcript_95490/m.303115 type:complete len:227 (+) Transcript_95490:828-1508(+)